MRFTATLTDHSQLAELVASSLVALTVLMALGMPASATTYMVAPDETRTPRELHPRIEERLWIRLGTPDGLGE